MYPYKSTPLPHQREELRASAGLRAWALFWDPGTGKTFTLLNTFGYQWLKGRVDCMLVFAPNGVHTNWVRDEIPAHLPDALQARVVEWDTGRSTTLWWQRSWAEAIAETGRPLIVCVNTEAIRSSRVYAMFRKLMTARKVMLVVDESADIAKAASTQSRRIHVLGKRAVSRRIADGTPNSEEPDELYGQLRFLDFPSLGVKDHASFKEKYYELYEADFGGPQPVKLVKKDGNGRPVYKNLADLQQRVARISSRVRKTDLHDLPEKVYAPPRYYDVSPEQYELLTQLRSEYQAVLQSGETVTADMRIVRDIREQQILCGYVPVDPEWLDPEDPDADPVRLIPGAQPRVDCLMDMVRRVPGKTLIWTRFRLDISTFLLPALRDAGYQVVRYDGATGKEEREEAITRFQTGDADIFLGNPAACGRGLTLHAGVHGIFYSNYYSLRRRLQSEDRQHRVGLRHSVLISDLIARGADVDERIVRAHRAKQPVAAFVLGDQVPA